MIYRWVAALFFVISVGVVVYEDCRDSRFGFFFIYLSNINLVASMICALIGAVMTTLHFTEKISSDSSELSLVLKFYWYLWTQSFVLACIITPVYWIFLHKDLPVTASCVFLHATNAIFFFIDLAVVRHPRRIYNFFYMLVFVVSYLVFTVIYQFANK